MSIRGSLLLGLAILAVLGFLQGAAALLGNHSLQQSVFTQTERLSAVNYIASAQLAFERADRAEQGSRRAANPDTRRALADVFRTEAARLQTALKDATALQPNLAAYLKPAAEWIEQVDRHLPGSNAGPQAELLRDDLIMDLRNARQSDIATAFQAMLDRADAAQSDAAHAERTIEYSIISLLILTLAAGAWLTLLLRRRVLKPLAALTRTTLQLAAGELDCVIDGTNRKDEIGAVAIALETLRQGNLRAQLIETAAALERETSDARIRYLAHHDPLTGLANRAMLQERLDYSLAFARRKSQQVALFWIDLDRFKTVNDSRGHAAGDMLLCEVARRLSAIVRDTDTVARVGGDEFVVVQAGFVQPDAADKLAGRVVDALSENYDIGGGEQASVSASIGIALFPSDGTDASALHASADMALYRVKQSGRNSYSFFQAEMDHEAHQRQALEQDLRLALQREQFCLVYQPQLDLGTNTVIGFEALLRWNHPERGVVRPDEFIPIAEASTGIVTIGAWVLGEACAEAARWTAPLRVAVNVSPIQFQKCDMAALVAEVLERTRLPSSRLELEVTESVLIRNSAETLDALKRIRQSGVSVALDDFGTGYSSLSTLRSFPFDRIKIDRSFVRDLASSPEAAVIVHTILGLARGMGLPVVGEGVEDEEQLAILKAADCAEAQGYLIGKPLPVEGFIGLTNPLKRQRIA